ncbi:hypothetical protein L596_002546 [Steinernema carpocapsae]|uniref:Uncharacterized protein n=1 Tax=Steinernema carpocapsae TaxID=34508 RepID=A0A4U8UPU0_STECR|nr:hypothetical protein L596_002546 [Steinernema carpocapsae]
MVPDVSVDIRPSFLLPAYLIRAPDVFKISTGPQWLFVLVYTAALSCTAAQTRVSITLRGIPRSSTAAKTLQPGTIS